MKTHKGKMLILLLFAGAILMANGCGGPAVVPTSYKTYVAADGSFKIEYPAEWQAEGGAKSGFAWAKFTSGNAEINVDANAVGSVLGDIAKSGNPMVNLPGGGPDTAPVAFVHEKEKGDYEAEDSNYKEPAAPEVINTGFGDSRRSQYTSSGTFGGGIHGYRVTTLGVDKRIRVDCKCPESEWEALKPAFDKVTASVALGKP